MRFFALSLMSIFLCFEAQARVFDMNSESFAGYFLVTGGTSGLGQGAYSGEASNVSFDNSAKYNYSGEFGVIYVRPEVALRLGVEILAPEGVVTNGSSGGSNLYSDTSSVLGLIPKVTAEIKLSSSNVYRTFMAFSAGEAFVTMKNDYTLTAAGQAAYPSVSNGNVQAKGTGTLLAASLGVERLLNDATTFMLEGGYRELMINSLNYTSSTTTFSGAVTSGSQDVNVNGQARKLNLSGPFISLGFRFYL